MRFFIDGDPVQKNRPRASRGGHVYSDQSGRGSIVEYYKTILRDQFRRQGEDILTGPVKVRFVFYMRRPKSHYTKTGKQSKAFTDWHTSKPDQDNLVKFIKDCLNGIAYKDDSQVCYCESFKVYGDHPGTIVDVKRILEIDRRGIFLRMEEFF